MDFKSLLGHPLIQAFGLVGSAVTIFVAIVQVVRHLQNQPRRPIATLHGTHLNFPKGVQKLLSYSNTHKNFLGTDDDLAYMSTLTYAQSVWYLSITNRDTKREMENITLRALGHTVLISRTKDAADERTINSTGATPGLVALGSLGPGQTTSLTMWGGSTLETSRPERVKITSNLGEAKMRIWVMGEKFRAPSEQPLMPIQSK